MSFIRIKNGKIYDPLHGKSGLSEDLYLQDGKIVDKPGRVTQEIDAAGCVIMPGGIDMHCHIAGPAVQAARNYQLHKDGTRNSGLPVVPHARATGRLFLGMGYTTAMDAAVPGIMARLALMELADTPYIDRGYLSLMGNHRYIMHLLEHGYDEELRSFVGWSLQSTKSYGVKIVNPGGVENWKQISRKTLKELDASVDGYKITPRQIVRELSKITDQLNLPHAAHIHCNNLGYPGNWRTTLHTMESLEGSRGHFAHIQFHSYGGNENEPTSFCSNIDPLVDYLASHPEITVDIGHVTPGPACSITGDSPFAEHLSRLSGGRWFTSDVEQESSCGVIPGDFIPHKSLIHAVQWAIGLEWYLKVKNPWQVAMTSDHPNGGAFTRYPEIIALLMSRNLRDEMINSMPVTLKERTTLADLHREYSLEEIAIVTRAAPAIILGLKNKGHLGAGADADITIYNNIDDKRLMFQRPRYVIKQGEILIEEGEFTTRADLYHPTHGQTFWQPNREEHQPSRKLAQWFREHYTLPLEQYPVESHQLPESLGILDPVSS